MLLKKMVIFYFILIVTVLAFLAYAANSTAKNIIKTEVKALYEIEFDYKVSEINNIMEKKLSSILSICASQELHEISAEFSNSKTFNQQNYNQVKSRGLLVGLDNLQVILKGDHGKYIANQENSLTLTPLESYEQVWYNDAMAKSSKVFYYNIYDEKRNIIRLSKAFFVGGEVAGVVMADIDIYEFSKILLNTKSKMMIVNEYNAQLYPYIDYSEILSLINLENTGADITNDFLIMQSDIYLSGWRLVGFVPISSIMSQASSFNLTFISIVSIVAILCFFVILAFSNSITHPISKLSQKMLSFKRNNISSFRIEGTYKGEIGVLYTSFNDMVGQINTLIDDVYKSQIKVKDAEMKALLSQINPHFLYNTLNSINWMAMKYEAHDITEMTVALADMLRYGLNNGQNLISIGDEIKQVASYVKIQQIRYPGVFEMECEIEKQIEKYKIIKLLLQPLVENAILHGFSDIQNGGKLLIKGYLAHRENCVIIEVRNNGKKIDLSKVGGYLYTERGEAPKSYGLRNVNDRLVNSYGEAFALTYLIEDDNTIARVKFPIDILEREMEEIF